MNDHPTNVMPIEAATTAAPTVSVVIPAYNAEAHLRAAMDSVLSQTFTDFEVIVVNDGSKDGTGQILAEYERRDPRVRVLTQTNAGIVEALNRGIRESRGTYIARMDSDDVCLSNRLAVQVQQMDASPDCVLLGSFVATTDESGDILSDVVEFPTDHESLWGSIGRKKWVFCHPAVMFRREIALEVGLYRHGFIHAEDTEFFARLMTRGRACNLPQVLLNYRLRRDAVCSRHREHGRVYAEVVAGMIDRWQPGETFEPTAPELAAAKDQIARLRPESQRAAEGVYWLRIGREQLRGRQFRRAVQSYKKSISLNPLRLLPYVGIVCAYLHIRGRRKLRSNSQLQQWGSAPAPLSGLARTSAPLGGAATAPSQNGTTLSTLEGSGKLNGDGSPPVPESRPAWSRSKDPTHV